MYSAAVMVRFMAKVELPAGQNGCWQWKAFIHPNGYGRFKLGSRMCQAHRVSYELHVGPIPEGLTLDHLCRRTACVNPAHLEPVTIGVNTLRGTSPSANNARKTACPEGHPYRRVGKVRRCDECDHKQAIASGRISGKPAPRDRTACPQGHLYDAANTYVSRFGRRHCRACDVARHRARLVAARERI